MAPASEIFVTLIGGGADAWRLVAAEPLDSEYFRITSSSPDPEVEIWEFVQGELVRCEPRVLSGGFRRAFPELTVLQRMPRWMTPQHLQRLESCALDEPSGLLALLRGYRNIES